MVISVVIAHFMVSKVLIDQGSSMDILYWNTFQRLKVSPDTIQPYYGPLLDFTRKIVEIRGYIDLITNFGQGKLSWRFIVGYLIVEDASYFALIGRITLNELGAIVSTPHLKMKVPIFTGEIVTIKVDQKQTRQCYVESLKVAPYPLLERRESLIPHLVEAIKS